MTSTSEPPATVNRRIAVIVNPTKFDSLDDVRATVAQACSAAGWGEPIWHVTTEDDPGEGQARLALEEGADVVCPLGGDGTVRAVASALVGTDTPIGLLPGGTGNLLARNLDLPVQALEDALHVALTGTNRRIDVGLVRLSDSAEPLASRAASESPQSEGRQDDELVFLVMAGMGTDAQVMAGTNESVKSVLGWPAYVLSGVRNVWSRGFHATVTGDQVREVRQHSRNVIVGNCGELQGGVALMPDAQVDDGRLDAVVISPHGVLGWAAVITDLATRHHRGHPRLRRLSVTTLVVRSDRPVETQVDGDPMGKQHSLAVRILPRSLVVRVG